MWGSATSSHQVEGDNSNNDWWQSEHAGKLKFSSGKACDHYNLYKEDFKLARELKHNSHRFSLEWSRIETKEGEFDCKAIGHYKDMIKTLVSLDIKPIVTIHHYTLPVWVAEKGGWENRSIPIIFAGFVKKVVEELGENVEFWITLNEPVANIYKSYIEAVWPPHKSSFPCAIKVFKHMLKAHCEAYKIIHKTHKQNGWKTPKVSIAKHFLALSPCRKTSFFDNLSKNVRSYLFNDLFVRALVTGKCIVPGLIFLFLSAKKTLDFIGINYYTRDFVNFGGLSPRGILGNICTLEHHTAAGKRNFLNWEIYPEGMDSAVKCYSKYNLPILITENGICTGDDAEREGFIREHIGKVAKSISSGVNVIGYIYWSLLDNFEWSEGFGPRFGLIEVDYKTQKRTIRSSARSFSGIIDKNTVEMSFE